MHATIHREKEQDSMSLMLKLIFLTRFQFLADGQILLVSCAMRFSFKDGLDKGLMCHAFMVWSR